MIELGQKGKDKITGFTGILTSRQQYITGCDQYTLTPGMNEDKELMEQYSFDEDRIKIIGRGILPKDVSNEKNPGGPHRPSRSVK